MANSVDPDQTAPIGAVCSGSTLFASILDSSVIFASILDSSVMLVSYLQQTTSADDIFRCILLLGTLRVKTDGLENIYYFRLKFLFIILTCHLSFPIFQADTAKIYSDLSEKLLGLNL